MEELIIYHNGECSKSKGALELLQEMGVPHTVRYYLHEPLRNDELRLLLQKLGIKAYELVRKHEAIYKEKYEGKTLTEDEWLEALAEYPILIERPIVEKGEKAVIARPAEKALEII
jgi:arsenate reductase